MSETNNDHVLRAYICNIVLNLICIVRTNNFDNDYQIIDIVISFSFTVRDQSILESSN